MLQANQKPTPQHINEAAKMFEGKAKLKAQKLHPLFCRGFKQKLTLKSTSTELYVTCLIATHFVHTTTPSTSSLPPTWGTCSRATCFPAVFRFRPCMVPDEIMTACVNVRESL
jgi:hypothetical protein